MPWAPTCLLCRVNSSGASCTRPSNQDGWGYREGTPRWAADSIESMVVALSVPVYAPARPKAAGRSFREERSNEAPDDHIKKCVISVHDTGEMPLNLVPVKGEFNMSKAKSVLVAVVLLSTFMVTPAFPQGLAGCKSGLFIGSYTHLDTFSDIWGDGTGVINQTIRQLTLHSDGTATEDSTGALDIMLSGGTISSRIGSWTCRNDGRLVVTLIWAVYLPTADAASHGVVPTPPVDILLAQHTRATYLFSVTDANQLTLIQARRRVYSATEDPTDPTGGVLRPLNTGSDVYKRLVASDADLLAP